jgi:glycerophosphoryl diester phosphodiesterase
VDLRRTSGGEFVVNHDSNLERVAGVDEDVADLTLAELNALRIDPRDPEGEYDIPTFEEVLDAFVKHATPDAHLALHLKGSGWEDHVPDLLASLVAHSELSKIDLCERMFVFDVDVETARRFADADPTINVGLSIGESDYFPTDRYPTIYRYEDVRDLRCWDVVWADEWEGGLYTPAFVERVRADERAIVCVSPELHAVTEPSHPHSDSPERTWQQLLEFGVDGVCTDFPTELRAMKQ